MVLSLLTKTARIANKGKKMDAVIKFLFVNDGEAHRRALNGTLRHSAVNNENRSTRNQKSPAIEIEAPKYIYRYSQKEMAARIPIVRGKELPHFF
jgi:hypothetical protein